MNLTRAWERWGGARASQECGVPLLPGNHINILFHKYEVAGSIPDKVTEFFFYWPNPSRCAVVFGSIQPVTGTSKKNLSGGKGLPGHEADNLTVIRLSAKYRIFNVLQPYRPSLPVTGIALLYVDGVSFLWGTNWTVSTATSSQYLAVNCEPIV
jgi:hypothetical protein